MERACLFISHTPTPDQLHGVAHTASLPLWKKPHPTPQRLAAQAGLVTSASVHSSHRHPRSAHPSLLFLHPWLPPSSSTPHFGAYTPQKPPENGCMSGRVIFLVGLDIEFRVRNHLLIGSQLLCLLLATAVLFPCFASSQGSTDSSGLGLPSFLQGSGAQV